MRTFDFCYRLPEHFSEWFRPQRADHLISRNARRRPSGTIHLGLADVARQFNRDDSTAWPPAECPEVVGVRR